MVLYKDRQYFTHHHSPDFDRKHNPGEVTPHSGIYRCEVCGNEVASNAGSPLPPQNHHLHRVPTLVIQWRLIAYAQGLCL